LSIFFSVTFAIIVGGIVLFFLYGLLQGNVKQSMRRLNEYFKKYYGTPLDVIVYFGAKESLEKKYGEDWVNKLSGWALERGLLNGPEARIKKLHELAEVKDKEDKDWDMHFYVLRHWAIRQWAKEIGDEVWFDNWENECIEQIKKMDAAKSGSK
jgi:hypothetical protein